MYCAKRFVAHSRGLVTGVSITSSLTNKALVSLQRYKMNEADETLKEAEKLLRGHKGSKPYDYYVAKSLYYLKRDQISAAQELFNEARSYYPNMVGDGDFAWMLRPVVRQCPKIFTFLRSSQIFGYFSYYSDNSASNVLFKYLISNM